MDSDDVLQDAYLRVLRKPGRAGRWGAPAALLLALAGLWAAVASVDNGPVALALTAALLPPAALGVGWWIWRAS